MISKCRWCSNLITAKCKVCSKPTADASGAPTLKQMQMTLQLDYTYHLQISNKKQAVKTEMYFSISSSRHYDVFTALEFGDNWILSTPTPAYWFNFRDGSALSSDLTSAAIVETTNTKWSAVSAFDEYYIMCRGGKY